MGKGQPSDTSPEAAPSSERDTVSHPRTASLESDATEIQPLLEQPIKRRSRQPRDWLLWGGLAVLLVLFTAGTFLARTAHRPLLTATMTPDPNVSGGVLFVFPNPIPAGPGEGTTAVAWVAPNGAMAQIWVSISGAPETLFAQGGSGAQYAPWVRHGETYVFRLYLGTAHTGVPVKSVAVTRD